jgi:integrase
MFRASGPTTLGEYVRDYGLFHDCRPETLRQYAISVGLFERWAGGPVLLTNLDAASVSEWIRDYAASGVAPNTVRSKRNHVCIMWRAAADDGLCELPTRRVRPVRCPWKPPVAWTLEEVDQLLVACQRLQRWHPCGIRRSAWWDLAIRVAWDAGLRWEDQVRRLRLEQVRPDGTIAFGQSKTGSVVVPRLSPETLAALAASLVGHPRELVTPWTASHETFTAQFKRIVRLAGIRSGTWKWLRRSSATDCEIQKEGSATEQLGHRPGSQIARLSYIDPALVAASRSRVRPRPLHSPTMPPPPPPKFTKGKRTA